MGASGDRNLTYLVEVSKRTPTVLPFKLQGNNSTDKDHMKKTIQIPLTKQAKQFLPLTYQIVSTAPKEQINKPVHSSRFNEPAIIESEQFKLKTNNSLVIVNMRLSVLAALEYFKDIYEEESNQMYRLVTVTWANDLNNEEVLYRVEKLYNSLRKTTRDIVLLGVVSYNEKRELCAKCLLFSKRLVSKSRKELEKLVEAHDEAALVKVSSRIKNRSLLTKELTDPLKTPVKERTTNRLIFSPPDYNMNMVRPILKYLRSQYKGIWSGL